MKPRISVIIPTLNESSNLETCVGSLGSDRDFELLVVDGGSKDRTPELAQSLGARVIRSQACRASQMNIGAQSSSNEILLFLHADTVLPPDWKEVVYQIICFPGVSVGAFKFKLDDDRLLFQLIERLANFRSHFFQMPYGDQAIFVKRDIFFRLGAFPEISIMEDFVFCRTARKLGRIKTASSAVVTSGRRWRRRGIIKTTLINQLIIASFALGVSHTRLRELYDSVR